MKSCACSSGKCMRAKSIVRIGNAEGISSMRRCAQLAGKRGSSVHIDLVLQALADGGTRGLLSPKRHPASADHYAMTSRWRCTNSCTTSGSRHRTYLLRRPLSLQNRAEHDQALHRLEADSYPLNVSLLGAWPPAQLTVTGQRSPVVGLHLVSISVNIDVCRIRRTWRLTRVA
jgi:hypothetical protein